MDQFASVFGKSGHLIRLDCRSLEYEYIPFDPVGYKVVLIDSVVKHELASSAYNRRRESCEAVVAAIQKHHPEVSLLRDADMKMLAEVKDEVRCRRLYAGRICDRGDSTSARCVR